MKTQEIKRKETNIKKQKKTKPKKKTENQKSNSNGSHLASVTSNKHPR